MKELLISFIFALIVGSIINGCSQGQPLPESPDSEQPSTPDKSSTETLPSRVMEATDTSFEKDVLSSSEPVLVAFMSKSDKDCQMMQPIVESIANQYAGKLKVAHLDVDDNPRAAEQYTEGGLPTLVVFAGGRAREMLVGYLSPENLRSTIKPYIR